MTRLLNTRSILGVLMLACASVVLTAGCEEKGPAEKAGQKVDQAAKKTGEAMKDAGNAVKDAAKGK